MSRKQNKKKSHSALREHRQHGKELVPPLMQIKGMKLSSWINNRLPEMLWVGLLLDRLPRIPTLDRLRDFGDLVHEIGAAASDLTLSGMSSNPDVCARLVSALCQRGDWQEALSPLLLFSDLPALPTWESQLPKLSAETAWLRLGSAVATMLDHQSETSTDARWVYVIGNLASGLLHLTKQEHVEMFTNITAYPHAGDLRAIRPEIRSAEGALSELGANRRTWADSFWAQCMRDTPCVSIPTRISGAESVATATLKDVNGLYDALVARTHATRASTAVDAKHDGAFGIALYAVSILLELIRVEGATSITSRLALRTLLEATITIRFLEKNGDLWMAFRAYGAGQAKLAFLKADESQTILASMAPSTLEELANEDAWLEFVTIDLGHWAKKDLRRLSEEAGAKDLYDAFYSWTSAYAHSQWCATRDVIFDTCGNPLHRVHRIPRDRPRALPDALADAVSLMNHVLDSTDRLFPGQPTLPRLGSVDAV